MKEIVLNGTLAKRLEGMRVAMLAAHHSSSSMSNFTKGAEREFFVNLFLESVFPPHFRFGSGEIIDSIGHKTGQLDIVIELPFVPSFPCLGATSTRLYLAEGVGAVIEVKSSLASQLEQASSSCARVRAIRRTQSAGVRFVVHTEGDQETLEVPYYVVAYKGHTSDPDKLVELCSKNGFEGILTLDPPLFAHRSNIASPGPFALFGFIDSLNVDLATVAGRYAPIGKYLRIEDATVAADTAE